MIHNRRGIELPASMLIILIISIVVFGFAGGLTYRLVCGAEDRLAMLSAAQENELERRLATGSSVIIPDSTKRARAPSSLCSSSRVAGAVYALGIRNDEPDEQTFTIECSNPDGSLAQDCDTIQHRDEVTLAPGQREVLAIVANVNPQTPKGRHVYTMTVTNSDSPPTFSRSVNFYLDVE
jgi:hypothetical protein